MCVEYVCTYVKCKLRLPRASSFVTKYIILHMYIPAYYYTQHYFLPQGTENAVQYVQYIHLCTSVAD
jgi:hypothetical protein